MTAKVPTLCNSYLQTLSDGLQHVRNDGVVPKICKPHLRSLHIHGTGQEEAWSCRGSIQNWVPLYTCMKCTFYLFRYSGKAQNWKDSYFVRCNWVESHDLIFLSFSGLITDRAYRLWHQKSCVSPGNGSDAARQTGSTPRSLPGLDYVRDCWSPSLEASAEGSSPGILSRVQCDWNRAAT